MKFNVHAQLKYINTTFEFSFVLSEIKKIYFFLSIYLKLMSEIILGLDIYFNKRNAHL